MPSQPDHTGAEECAGAAHKGDVEVVSMQVTTETHIAFDFYSCEECIKRLNDYLDHELSPEERDDVVRHLNLCKPCLERFHFEENLIVSLRQKVTHLCAPSKLREKLSKLIKPQDSTD
jgi:anti-sigma factor (TIGR02949 family)